MNHLHISLNGQENWGRINHKRHIMAYHLSLLPPAAFIPMCFHSKLHPHIKQNHFQHYILPTVNNDITVQRNEAAPHQPAAVSDQTKQQGCTTMKARHQTRQQGGRARERQERGEDRNANCEVTTKKAIVSGIWVNNSGLAVKLSLCKCKCC